jgi:hypothetical protein
MAAKRALIKVASGKDAASMNKTPPAPCLRRSPSTDVWAADYGCFLSRRSHCEHYERPEISPAFGIALQWLGLKEISGPT